MISGLYSAATGMMAIEARQAVTSNNIANASTPGFRRQHALQKGFYGVLLDRLSHPLWLDARKGPGGGLEIIETFTDTTGGPITTTGDPLNVALQGPGFVAVDTPRGERFTRNGAFSVGPEGQLVTSEGHVVQSLGGGPISVDGANVLIADDGNVLVDGLPQGQIRLVEFEDSHMLSREGHNLYSASEEALLRSAPAEETRIAPGSLEMSNVNLPHEMVQLTVAMRAYNANQKVINATDETMSRLISDVGSPI
jgi:flagellar basal-body rod protein FlgG